MKAIGGTEILSATEVENLTRDVLTRAGAASAPAGSVARAIRHAEERGHRRLGLGLVPHMVEHLRCGRVDGQARPVVSVVAPGAMAADAAGGFACPAIEQALPDLQRRARRLGAAVLTLQNAYPLVSLGPLQAHLSAEGFAVVASGQGVVSRPGPGGALVLDLAPVAHGLPDTPDLPKALVPDRWPASLPDLPFEGPLGGPFRLRHHIVVLHADSWPMPARPAMPLPEDSGIAVPVALLERVINA